MVLLGIIVSQLGLVTRTWCYAVLPLLLRADDEVDRQALVRQQNKVAALEAQLAGLKVGGVLRVWTSGNTAQLAAQVLM